MKFTGQGVSGQTSCLHSTGQQLLPQIQVQIQIQI